MKRLIIPLVLTLLVFSLILLSSPTGRGDTFKAGYGYACPEEVYRSDDGVVTLTVPPQKSCLKDFADQHELAVWMSTAPWIFPNPKHFDCDDYARTFQKIAEVDGYRLNLELDTTQYPTHMLNSIVVNNNELWFIEPQNHTYWFVVYLDPPMRD